VAVARCAGGFRAGPEDRPVPAGPAARARPAPGLGVAFALRAGVDPAFRTGVEPELRAGVEPELRAGADRADAAGCPESALDRDAPAPLLPERGRGEAEVFPAMLTKLVAPVTSVPVATPVGHYRSLVGRLRPSRHRS